MIRGVHTMFYSSQADELRAFLRDKLGFSYTDVGEGWLIFDLPEADMGVHPSAPDGAALVGTHDISFYCDDVQQTMRELKAKGVEFTMDVEDHGYGLVTYFKMPGGVLVQLYQPRYQKKPQDTARPRARRRETRKVAKRAMASRGRGNRQTKKAARKTRRAVRRK